MQRRTARSFAIVIGAATVALVSFALGYGTALYQRARQASKEDVAAALQAAYEAQRVAKSAMARAGEAEARQAAAEAMAAMDASEGTQAIGDSAPAR